MLKVTNDDSMQKEVWHKLLEQCREILSLALGALTPTLENDRVRSELGSCPEWVNFCCSAVLVYGVALRVMSSYRATNINDDSVNELIKSVDVCWSELKPFFTPEVCVHLIFSPILHIPKSEVFLGCQKILVTMSHIISRNYLLVVARDLKCSIITLAISQW